MEETMIETVAVEVVVVRQEETVVGEVEVGLPEEDLEEADKQICSLQGLGLSQHIDGTAAFVNINA